MQINSFEEFEKTWDLVKRNCAGSVRAFSSVDYPITQPEIRLNSSTVNQLVYHTLRSGALSLCRVWDRNSRSVSDLVPALRGSAIIGRVRPSLAKRLEFLTLFDEGKDGLSAELTKCVGHDDDVVLSALVGHIEKNHQSLLNDETRTRLFEFRNKFLGHSAGVGVSGGNRTDYIACKAFLLSTLKMIDKIQWLIENESVFVQSFYATLEDGNQAWEENKLIRDA